LVGRVFVDHRESTRVFKEVGNSSRIVGDSDVSDSIPLGREDHPSFLELVSWVLQDHAGLEPT
jgi:hypothetical protein